MFKTGLQYLSLYYYVPIGKFTMRTTTVDLLCAVVKSVQKYILIGPSAYHYVNNSVRWKTVPFRSTGILQQSQAARLKRK